MGRALLILLAVLADACAESTPVCTGIDSDASVAAFDPSSPTGTFSGQALALPSTGAPVGAAWEVDIVSDGDGGFCFSWRGSRCVLTVLPFGQDAFLGSFDGAPFRFNTETWHARQVVVVTHYGRDLRGIVDVSIIADEGTMVWQLAQVTP